MHNRATTFGAASGRGDLPDRPNKLHRLTFFPDGARASNWPAPVVVAPRETPLKCADSPDELEILLAALRFRHWRGCLEELLERYDGWGAALQRTTGSLGARAAPDDAPLADVISVLDALPAELAGQDKALARALLACPFLRRTATDAHTSEPWEPLEQTFRSFSARRAVRLALMPCIPWPERDFIDRTLEQLVFARSSNWSALRP
jgi:hypothetical protein